MKKILILLISAILLTGCNATYDINVKSDKIEDTITIMTDSSNVSRANKTTTDLFNQKIGEWENGHDFYKREIVTTEEKTGYQYKYSFTYDEYDAMSQIRKCYENFNIDTTNGLKLSTSEEFLCKNYYPQVNSITISITSDYEIKNSNADSVRNNTHIWKINSKNYKNKPINIEINKHKTYEEDKEKNTDTFKNILFILFFIIIVIIFIRIKKDIKK